MMRVSARQYAEALRAAYLDAKPNERAALLQHFLHLLFRARRLKLLPAIQMHLVQLEDQAEQQTHVTVWSAHPIDPHALSHQLEKVLGRVRLDTLDDQAALGGLKLRISDTLLDGTLRGRLKRLQIHLTTS
jgi:F-type H+-transporting ATPase subunit delta